MLRCTSEKAALLMLIMLSSSKKKNLYNVFLLLSLVSLEQISRADEMYYHEKRGQFL